MTQHSAPQRLTPSELEVFEATLIERKQLLSGDLQSMEESDAQDSSELSTLSTHLADQGTDLAESDVSLGCRASTSSEIQEIGEALERIRDGSYGICESCEKLISKERLEAIPYARLCIPCKQLEEV